MRVNQNTNRQLSEERQAKIIAEYSPIMFLHTSEKNFPIRPESVIKKSALWGSQDPHDSKTNWGIGNSSTRNPIIQRGDIPINSYSPFNYPSYYENHHFKEVWLESEGWQNSELVDFSTDNKTCREVSTTNKYQKEIDGPWFYAEVIDEKSFSELFESKEVIDQVGLNREEFEQMADNLCILCFYFLFPNHIENSKIARADGSVEAAGNFEGDWACYCVILKNEQENFKPFLAGFSRSRRGTSVDFGTDHTQQYMEILPWDQIKKVENHVGVVVALGTHNLYSLDTNNAAFGSIKPQWVDFGKSTSEPFSKFARDLIESPSTMVNSAIVLAKMAAGFGIAGPFGALGGLVAGIAEAVAINDAIHEEHELEYNPDALPEGELEDPKDEFEEDVHSAQIIVPHGQNELATMLVGDVDLANISHWIENDVENLVNREKQLFWSGLLNYVDSAPITSRWGVRCSDDIFNRRAGGKFPDYRLQTLKSIIEFL
jgi:hypothetical protein